MAQIKAWKVQVFDKDGHQEWMKIEAASPAKAKAAAKTWPDVKRVGRCEEDKRTPLANKPDPSSYGKGKE